MSFATPYSSPTKHQASFNSVDSMCESPPPLKQQRLFSPSPTMSQSRSRGFSSIRQPTALFSSSASPTDQGFESDDSFLASPPKIERLQLFDYPCTPMSIMKSSGVPLSSKKSFLHRSVDKFFVGYTILIFHSKCAHH